MARDDSRRDRDRKRAEEDEKDEALRSRLGRGPTPGSIKGASIGSLGGSTPGAGPNVDDLLKKAEPMIEQVNNLYNQFVAGAEKQPPREKRKQLDQTMQTLAMSEKATPGVKFKYQNLLSRYNTYKDRWDKLLKDLEDGKIRRQF